MNRLNFHGIVSIALFTLSIIVAMIFLFTINFYSGIAYLSLITVTSAIIIFAFCSKCPVNKNCGHFLPGKIAVSCTNRKSCAYSKSEINLTFIFIFLTIAFPQYWIWSSIIVFCLFWFLIAIAAIEVRLYVCPRCENYFCPANPKFTGR